MQIRWDIVWKPTARDHAAIVMTLEDTTGNMGHERHSIDEQIISETRIKNLAIHIINDTYDHHKTEPE